STPMRNRLVWIAAVLLLCRLGWAQAVIPVPSATGYLTDQTGIVEPAEMARIQVMLGKYEVASRHRVSVLLVQATPDEELEVFADRVLAAWGLDHPEQGGALLLWSAEGYVLIRAAGPLSERLNGETQEQILSRWVVPGFARGEAGVGIRQGVEQIMAVLDGGSVAEAPPEPAQAEDPQPQDGASAQEQAVLDALEFDADDEPEEPQEEIASIAREVSFDGLPVWVERLPQDLARLAAPFSEDLDAGMVGWLREAGREADQLPVQLSGLFLQMRGERVEPPFPGLSEFAVYAWAVSLGLALLVLLSRRAFVPALFMAAVDTGFFLWLATGFVALGGLIVLVGLLAPLLVPVLQVILRGSDDSARDDDPPSVSWPTPQTTLRSTSHALSTRAAAVSARAASKGKPQVRVAVAGPPATAPIALSSTDSNRQRVDVLLDRLGRIAFDQARRLRLMHVAVAVTLCIISFPLAVLVLLGTLVVVAYRSGAAYLLADALVSDRNAREQLKRTLPRPSADIVPGS
ncbi:MAG: TPM domain-containing protein, partial [Panacagrimonas sp.]